MYLAVHDLISYIVEIVLKFKIVEVLKMVAENGQS